MTAARWMPGTYTGPLSETLVSDGPKLRRFVELFCRDDSGNPLVLDPWQAFVVDAILERYPHDWPVEELAGRLRYREVVISLARQNGKSEIAHVLGFYGLFMHESNPYVVGLASNKEQADLVYRRVRDTARANKALRSRLKATGTRGINRVDKTGFYITKPAKADALQGIPVTLCLFDEVHICDEDMWSAMVLGTQAKADGIVVGITTAGDDNSTLLKNLYKRGRESAAGQGSERFGFFLWEAAEGARIDDPEAIKDANPSVACGRRDLNVLLDAVRGMPEHDARRYVLNQFVSSQSAWLPMSMWHSAAYGPVPDGDIVFTIDRTPSWEHACITATVKKDNTYYTEVVASLRKPNLEWLVDVCLKLWKHGPVRFVMDGYTLGDLGRELERRGMPVKIMRQSDVTNACATAYALIASGKVKHNDDALLRQQMPFAVRKNVGDAWRINRQASSVAIDAVMATVLGLYACSLEREPFLDLL